MVNLSLADRIDAVIRVFLYILIFWLPYSPAVVESCVVTCLLLWIFKRCILLISPKGPAGAGTPKERLSGFVKGFKPELTFLNKPIAFFLAACILSVTNSAFFAQSLHNFFTKTLEWFVIYFLVVESFKTKKHVYIAFTVFIFTAFSTVLDSLSQFYITGKDIFLGYMIEIGSRATAGFKTPNGLGGYLTGVISIVAAWIFLGQQELRYRLAAVTVLCFSIWSLVITFSRGAWIGVFFGGMFLLFSVLFPKKRLKLYFSLGLLWVTVFLGISLLLILANGSDRELFTRYQTIQWRFSVWSISGEMIKDKFFFGHGINTFMRVFQVYRGNFMMGPTYAHNCYIQLAAETGIVGLCCFFWMVATVFHQSLGKLNADFQQDRNLRALAIGLLSGIFAFLVHSFFDTNFYSLQLSVYLWFMIGMLVVIVRILDMSKAPKEAIIEKQ